MCSFKLSWLVEASETWCCSEVPSNCDSFSFTFKGLAFKLIKTFKLVCGR